MTTTLESLNPEEVGSLASIIMVLQRKFMGMLLGELSHDRLSFPQFFLLGHLGSHGPTGMTSIAELMGHSTPAATGLVQRLEKLGYVKRTHGIDDRRKVTVAVTPKGIRLVEGIRQEMIENLTKVNEQLSPKDQRAWLDIYKKIHNYCITSNS
jgi:DNA-binding MarR family transcriptional regulator